MPSIICYSLQKSEKLLSLFGLLYIGRIETSWKILIDQFIVVSSIFNDKLSHFFEVLVCENFNFFETCSGVCYFWLQLKWYVLVTFTLSDLLYFSCIWINTDIK